MKSVDEGNLLSTEKEKSIQYFTSRISLHSLVENYISGTIKFITTREEVIMKVADGKGKNTELKIAKLP